MDSLPRIFFIHIPRTGGLTLQTIIKRHYPGRTMLKIGVAPGKMRYDDFLKMSGTQPGRLSHCRCVTGHIPFGMHRYWSDDSIYLTMLRDPIKRYASQCQRLSAMNGKVSYPFLAGKKLDNLLTQNTVHAFDAFAGSELGRLSRNLQTRFLSGISPEQEVDHKALAQAKSHLARENVLVGITESFDTSLVYFARVTGWTHLYYQKKNVTPKNGSNPWSKPELAGKIGDLNGYDVELYDYAKDLFEKRLSVLPPSFKRRAKRFSRVNRYAGRLDQWVQRMFG